MIYSLSDGKEKKFLFLLIFIINSSLSVNRIPSVNVHLKNKESLNRVDIKPSKYFFNKKDTLTKTIFVPTTSTTKKKKKTTKIKLEETPNHTNNPKYRTIKILFHSITCAQSMNNVKTVWYTYTFH